MEVVPIRFSIITTKDGSPWPQAEADGELDLLALFLFTECSLPYEARAALAHCKSQLVAGERAARSGWFGGDSARAKGSDGRVVLEAAEHALPDFPERMEIGWEEFEKYVGAWLDFLDANGLEDPPEMTGKVT